MAATISEALPEAAAPENAVAGRQIAKITSKGQITIPAEIRRELGARPGDKLSFQRTPHGIVVTRQNDRSHFEQFRGIGNGVPELDGDIDSIVQYMREIRGRDEIDDRMLGTKR